MHTIAGHIRRSARLVGASTVAALLLGTLSTTTHAARALQIDAHYDSQCLGGHGPANATWRITWRDRDGELKLRKAATADADGYWSACDYDGSGVERGDEIAATVGTRGTSLIVPRLLLDVDRSSDIISATTEPGTNVVLEACSSRGFDRGRCVSVSGATGVDGALSHNFTGDLDLRGGGYGGANVRVGSHRVFRDLTTPYLTVYRGDSYFEGTHRSGLKVTVELRSGASLTADWQGQVTPWGWFEGRFTDEEGDRHKAQPGDRIVAPRIGADADWIVPPVDAGTNVVTDVVAGTCVPGGRYRVSASSANGSRWGRRSGVADGSGTFAIDMTKRIDIRDGYHIKLLCKLETGDVVARRTVAK